MEEINPIDRALILANKVCRQVCTRWRNIFDRFAHKDRPELLPSNLLRDEHFAIINSNEDFHFHPWSSKWKLFDDFVLANINKLDWKLAWNVRKFSVEIIKEYSKLYEVVDKLSCQIMKLYSGKRIFTLHTTDYSYKFIRIKFSRELQHLTLRCMSTGHYSITLRFQRDIGKKIEEYTVRDFSWNHHIRIENIFDYGYPLNVAVIKLHSTSATRITSI